MGLAIRLAILLFACCVTSVDALQFTRPGFLARSSPITLCSSQDPDERDEATKKEDDALSAAFAARLEKEGGVTQFKIKTSVTGAADSVKDAADDLASRTKDLVGGIPAPADLQQASAGQLLAGLAAISILFTVLNAAGRSSNSVDSSTSDGTTLEFGQRSQNRQLDRGSSGGSSYFGLNDNPYKAQLGGQ